MRSASSYFFSIRFIRHTPWMLECYHRWGWLLLHLLHCMNTLITFIGVGCLCSLILMWITDIVLTMRSFSLSTSNDVVGGSIDRALSRVPARDLLCVARWSLFVSLACHTLFLQCCRGVYVAIACGCLSVDVNEHAAPRSPCLPRIPLRSARPGSVWHVFLFLSPPLYMAANDASRYWSMLISYSHTRLLFSSILRSFVIGPRSTLFT